MRCIPFCKPLEILSSCSVQPQYAQNFTCIYLRQRNKLVLNAKSQDNKLCHALIRETNFKFLRNCHCKLVGRNTFYSTRIDAFDHVIIGRTTYYGVVYVSSLRIARSIHQLKSPAAQSPINVVAHHWICRTAGCAPTEVNRMCDRRARSAQGHHGRTPAARGAADRELT
jgi:hypothetical protein